MIQQADFSAGVILALDVGTSSLKGVLYSLADGHFITESSSSYGLQRPQPMWVEQSPTDWWSATQIVCNTLSQHAAAAYIRVIGLTGQVPTMVLVDQSGEAVGPALSWQDRRADVEAAWLRDEIGAEQLSAWFGLNIPIDPGWPPARLLWLARHRSEWIARTHKILMAKDYIGCQLSGAFCSDAWSSKGIAAVLIGGTSLFGGRGTVIGTVLGVLFIGLLGNGMTLLNVNTYLQDVARGGIILLAVIFGALQLRRTNS